MSMVQRLSAGLGPLLRLSGRQLASSQQAAALHLSTTLEARRRGPASSSDSDDERRPGSSGAQAPRGGAGAADGPNAAAPGDQQGAAAPTWDELNTAVSAEVATQAATFDYQTMVSPALAALLAEAPEDEEGCARAFDEFQEVTERWEQGKLKGDRPATTEDLQLLTEAIDLYLQSGPVEDPEEDVLEQLDQELLEALGEAVKELLGDGARTTVVNTAPPGRTPWEILDVNEEVPMVTWGMDLTEGKAVDPWKNAHLSEETKLLMYRLHKEGWEVPRLAQHFRVRQQRVMAILALKEREEAAAAAGVPLNDRLAEAMEDVQASWEVLGSGERHHVTLPSFPNYKELTEAEADKLAALLEERVGKPLEQITPDDLGEELVQEVLAAAGVDQAALEEELAATEEAHMVAEFKRALEYNVGKTGTSLSRSSRKKHPPARPPGGWSLLVQPLGRAARAGEREPYVALPDGSQRELTADERLHLERQQPRPHRKFL